MSETMKQSIDQNAADDVPTEMVTVQSLMARGVVGTEQGPIRHRSESKHRDFYDEVPNVHITGYSEGTLSSPMTSEDMNTDKTESLALTATGIDLPLPNEYTPPIATASPSETTDTVKNKRFNKLRSAFNAKRIGKVALATMTAVVAAAAFGPSATAVGAEKQLTVATSGRGDGEGKGMHQYLGNTIGANAVMNKYSGKIGPLDDERMDSSVAGGVRNGEAIIDRSGVKDKDLRLVGFSEGGVVASHLANNHPEAKVDLLGTPGIPGRGIAYSVIGNVVNPFMAPMIGIDLEKSKIKTGDNSRIVGATTAADFYGNGADIEEKGGLLGLASSVLDTALVPGGDAHLYTDARMRNPKNVTERQTDGSTVITVQSNGVGGFCELARANKMPCSEDAIKAEHALTGFSPDGQRTQKNDLATQASAVIDMVNEAAAIAKVPVSIPKPVQAPARRVAAKPVARKAAPAPMPQLNLESIRKQVDQGWNNFVRSLAPRR